MILFIAPNPRKIKHKEGFLQRVSAIDAILSSEEKLYSEDLNDPLELAAAIIRADVIYVHSIYNANKILGSYSRFAEKIITDMHGVVPEEEVYADNLENAKIMGYTEKEVFKYGKHFIAVSNSMANHFVDKYKLQNKSSWIILPIFDSNLDSKTKKIIPDKKTVVYAGGSQSWQNVDLMVDAIKKTKDTYEFKILTHNPESFKFEGTVNENTNIEVKTVPSKSIGKYYKRAVLGFILRNDTLVNNVACPTKLIEYLSYGILPIVLSENIGDFKVLGYKYVTIEEFLKINITNKDILSKIEHNNSVYQKFKKNAEQSKRTLIELTNSIKATKSAHSNNVTKELVASEFEVQNQKNIIMRYEYQIESYKQKIADYAEAVEYYRKQESDFKEKPIETKHGGLLNRIKHRKTD